MVELSVNEDGAPAAVVFKTIADPFVGKLSYFKVISGKGFPPKPCLLYMRTGNQERISKVMTVKGKQEDTAYISARVTSAPPPNCKY